MSAKPANAKPAHAAARPPCVVSPLALAIERGVLDNPSRPALQTLCPEWAASSGTSEVSVMPRLGLHPSLAALRTRNCTAERAIRRQCLVFGPFGKRLVKVYGFGRRGLNLKLGEANSPPSQNAFG